MGKFSERGQKQLPATAASNPINAEVRDQLNILTSQRNTRVLDASPEYPACCGLVCYSAASC